MHDPSTKNTVHGATGYQPHTTGHSCHIAVRTSSGKHTQQPAPTWEHYMTWLEAQNSSPSLRTPMFLHPEKPHRVGNKARGSSSVAEFSSGSEMLHWLGHLDHRWVLLFLAMLWSDWCWWIPNQRCSGKHHASRGLKKERLQQVKTVRKGGPGRGRWAKQRWGKECAQGQVRTGMWRGES